MRFGHHLLWDIGSLAEGTYYIYASIDDGTTINYSYGGPIIRLRCSGDMNGDGIVDVADALKLLKIAAGLVAATPDDLIQGDVAPFVNGKPQPDGRIDIGDVIIILRKAARLATW